jgi:SAM-dependent methyltransferase
MVSALSLDAINRKVWSSPQALQIYDTSHGYTDWGEKAALDAVRVEAAGRPILDIGVGAGRSTPLLKAICSDGYVGIDYCGEILERAKAKFPGTRLLQMDARDLSAFAAGSFFLANFSFNGIDSVDYAGRLRILAEVHRVLVPGGLFVFSCHNKDGPGSGETLAALRPQFTWNPAKLAVRSLRSLRAVAMSLLNYHRNRRLNRDYGGYSVSAAAAHNFGIVILYSTLAEQRRQLAEAGFSVEAVYENFGGDRVTEATDLSRVHWFHFVARKPA